MKNKIFTFLAFLLMAGIIIGTEIMSSVKEPVGYSPYNFRFCYVGLVFLMMLFIPNIIWTKFQPEGYSEYVKNENKVLGILEKIGEVGSTVLLLIFKDFNIRKSYLSIHLVLIFLLMLLYEIYWLRYFKSSHSMKDFYRGICGIPLAGATIPVLGLFIFAIYGRNLAMFVIAVVMGIGHIGIHYMHSKEVSEERN